MTHTNKSFSEVKINDVSLSVGVYDVINEIKELL